VFDPPVLSHEFIPARVTLTSGSRRKFVSVLTDPKGEWRNPVHPEVVLKKFSYLENWVFTDTAVVPKYNHSRMMEKLENLKDISGSWPS
jgi:hypothetical protein